MFNRHWLTSQHVMPALGLQRTFSRGPRENEPGCTLTRLFIVGGLAGSFETMVQQPLVYWKTMSQVNMDFGLGVVIRGGVRPLLPSGVRSFLV